MTLDLSGKARKRAQQKRTRTISAKKRRELYFEKSVQGDFDDFGVHDLQFFFRDLFELTHGIGLPPASAVQMNKIFGDLKEGYGPRDALNVIAASFSLGDGPTSIWSFQNQQFMGTLAKEHKHYRRLSQKLVLRWQAFVKEKHVGAYGHSSNGSDHASHAVDDDELS